LKTKKIKNITISLARSLVEPELMNLALKALLELNEDFEDIPAKFLIQSIS